jgi:hypothetical protein
MVEKSSWRLPSPPRQRFLARAFSGPGFASGSAGFGRCVSVCQPSSLGIVAALATATTSAPLPGNVHCNSAGVPAADESAARILSADTSVSSAGAPAASAAGLLASRDDWYDSRQGPWEVMTPRSSCPGEESTPLRGAVDLRLTAKSTVSEMFGTLDPGSAVALPTQIRPAPYRLPGSLLLSTGGSLPEIVEGFRPCRGICSPRKSNG